MYYQLSRLWTLEETIGKMQRDYVNISSIVENLQSHLQLYRKTFEASYIVYTNRTNYYAENGQTGEIISGTDATAVIQSVINRVAGLGGGTVFIKSGVYIVDTILIQGVSNVAIIGEGRNTKLIAKGSDTIVFKIGDRSNKSRVSNNIEIAYLYIDGSNQATETNYPEDNDRRFGIEVASPDGSASGIKLHHLYIYNTGSDSIYIYGPADVLVAYNILILLEATGLQYTSMVLQCLATHFHLINPL
jgi:hypothetical protein